MLTPHRLSQAVGFEAGIERLLNLSATGEVGFALFTGLNRGDEALVDNSFIAATDREILQDAGKFTAEIAQAHSETEFEKYRIMQDRIFESDFDQMIKQLPNLDAQP